MVDAWIGVVGVRRLVATSVALTALLVGGCGPPASRTSPVFPATSSPATPAISLPAVVSGTSSLPNPCQLLTLADVRQVYPEASHGLGPLDSPESFPEFVICLYRTGLPDPVSVHVIVRPDDDAAWARDLTAAVNSGSKAVPGLADAIISANATGGFVHRGARRVEISLSSPSGYPAVLTAFLGVVASRL